MALLTFPPASAIHVDLLAAAKETPYKCIVKPYNCWSQYMQGVMKHLCKITLTLMQDNPNPNAR